MNTKWIALSVLLISSVGLSQVPVGARRAPPSQESLIAKKKQKLAEAWLKNANWILDYDKAREIAKKEKKLIFTYFPRSYAP